MSELTAEVVLTAFNTLFATSLVAIGVWFVVAKVWPWWAERDEQERERRYQLALAAKTTDEAMALALSAMQHSLTNPIRVMLVGDDGEVL